MHRAKIKTYDEKDIQLVYQRFAENAAAVVYSDDGGYTWKTPPMDTGKWTYYKHLGNWLFAFLELKP